MQTGQVLDECLKLRDYSYMITCQKLSWPLVYLESIILPNEISTSLFQKKKKKRYSTFANYGTVIKLKKGILLMKRNNFVIN